MIIPDNNDPKIRFTPGKDGYSRGDEEGFKSVPKSNKNFDKLLENAPHRKQALKKKGDVSYIAEVEPDEDLIELDEDREENETPPSPFDLSKKKTPKGQPEAMGLTQPQPFTTQPKDFVRKEGSQQEVKQIVSSEQPASKPFAPIAKGLPKPFSLQSMENSSQTSRKNAANQAKDNEPIAFASPTTRSAEATPKNKQMDFKAEPTPKRDLQEKEDPLVSDAPKGMGREKTLQEERPSTQTNKIGAEKPATREKEFAAVPLEDSQELIAKAHKQPPTMVGFPKESRVKKEDSNFVALSSDTLVGKEEKPGASPSKIPLHPSSTEASKDTLVKKSMGTFNEPDTGVTPQVTASKGREIRTQDKLVAQEQTARQGLQQSLASARSEPGQEDLISSQDQAPAQKKQVLEQKSPTNVPYAEMIEKSKINVKQIPGTTVTAEEKGQEKNLLGQMRQSQVGVQTEATEESEVPVYHAHSHADAKKTMEIGRTKVGSGPQEEQAIASAEKDAPPPPRAHVSGRDKKQEEEMAENVDINFLVAAASTQTNTVSKQEDIKPVSRVVELQAIVDQLVKKLYSLEVDGGSDTFIVLKDPPSLKEPFLAEAKLMISDFDSAKGQLNISFTGLTQAAEAFLSLEKNKKSLIDALEQKGYAVQMLSFTTASAIESRPIHTQEERSNNQQDKQEGQGNMSGGDSQFSGNGDRRRKPFTPQA